MDAGKFEEEEDAEFSVDGITVDGELVGPREESDCVTGGLVVGEMVDDFGVEILNSGDPE